MSYSFYSFRNPDEHNLEQWSQRTVEGEVGSCRGRTLEAIFGRHLRDRSIKILEAGCGLGGWVIDLKEKGFQITGVDFDPRIVERVKAHDRRIPVEVGDVCRLRFKDGSFAAYVSLGVIEHFEEGPEQALREAFRVLRPGGLAFITVPYLNGFRKLWVHPLRNLFFGLRRQISGKRDYFWEYRYTRRELADYLEQAGFEIIETTIDDYEPADLKHHIGLYADFFFLRKKKGDIWELNALGRRLLRIARKFSPWLVCSGLHIVARKPDQRGGPGERAIQKRRIRVLQLIEGFNLGGAEKKLLELVRMMDPVRFKTVVCSLGLGDRIRPEFDKLGNSGIDVTVLPRRRRVDLFLIVRLIRLIRKHRIDVIMTTLFYADVLGPIAGRIAGVRRIYSWETISAPEWLISRRLWPYRAVIRLADGVVSVSRATAEWLHAKRGVPENKIRVIPYSVDLNRFATGEGENVRRRLGIHPRDIVVGMVGRLHPQKGQTYLIQAAPEIIRKAPRVRFVLIGDGDSRNDLEAQVRNAGLEKHFFFLGFRQDVHEIIHAIDIFTLPSLYEGLPNVILEAMAAGKPVVASSVDGTQELIEHGKTGLLVPPGDPDQLADAIIKLIQKREWASQMGREAQRNIRMNYSIENQIRAFEELYEHRA
jgi:glycosyltransferase involved in cell wall biosynthesis/SAM-dependent methyltransferase